MWAGTLKSIIVYLVMNNCEGPVESVVESFIAGLIYFYFFFKSWSARDFDILFCSTVILTLGALACLCFEVSVLNFSIWSQRHVPVMWPSDTKCSCIWRSCLSLLLCVPGDRDPPMKVQWDRACKLITQFLYSLESINFVIKQNRLPANWCLTCIPR